MINTVGILFTPGAGGHFLRHFLDPIIVQHTAEYFVDSKWFKTSTTPPYNKERFKMSHNKTFPVELMIGLGPSTLIEYIRVRTMVNTKNMSRTIDQLDFIIQDFHTTTIEYFSQDCDYFLPYTELFVWDRLEYLYRKINNKNPTIYKKKYFDSYKDKHDTIYNSWQYKVIEKICLFEYNNNLIESVCGKMRNWSIDDINEDNWQEFLEEKLCPTNYS